jgi:hypothetical protein
MCLTQAAFIIGGWLGLLLGMRLQRIHGCGPHRWDESGEQGYQHLKTRGEPARFFPENPTFPSD